MVYLLVLVFQLLLLVLLKFSPECFYSIVYRGYEVSIIPIQVLPKFILFFFLQFSSKCTHCGKAKIKKIKILKRKESNLFIPSKLHEAIKNADPERIKLTLQNIRWKIKLLNLKLIK